MSLRVTVISMGGSPQVVNVPPSATIEEACRRLAIDTEGRSFTLNGDKVALGSELSEGDTVLVAHKVTGG